MSIVALNDARAPRTGTSRKPQTPPKSKAPPRGQHAPSSQQRVPGTPKVHFIEVVAQYAPEHEQGPWVPQNQWVHQSQLPAGVQQARPDLSHREDQWAHQGQQLPGAQQPPAGAHVQPAWLPVRAQGVIDILMDTQPQAAQPPPPAPTAPYGNQQAAELAITPL